MALRLHIENDAAAPAALQLSAAQLQARLADVAGLSDAFIISENADPAQTARWVAEADILWAGRKLDLTALPHPALRWVQVMSAGVESWLAHWPAGLPLVNASGVHGAKGAEFVLMGALMFNFGIPGFLQDQALEQWQPTFGGPARGKKVLMLGLGGIGSAAAQLLQAQGYRVVGVTRSGKSEVPVSRCVTLDQVDGELADTDVLVSTLPLTPETRGLFGRERLAKLPAHAGVIIVGRADVFDYDALCDRLRAGQLGGALLDVFPQEPLPPGDPVWSCPRLVMTPHCSLDDHGAYLDGCLDLFLQNLERQLAGQTLINLVDPARGY